MHAVCGDGYESDMGNRDHEIRKTISDIIGIEPKQATSSETALDRSFLREVLFVASDFNFFQIEEEGRLYRLFNESFSPHGQMNTPKVSHVESPQDAMEYSKLKKPEIILIFNSLSNKDIHETASQLKKVNTDVLVVFIGVDPIEIQKLKKEDDDSLDWFFTWDGDGRSLVHIVRFLADDLSIKNKRFRENCKYILLIEDSVTYYSRYVSMIYKEITEQERDILREDVTREQLETRLARRPKLLLAEDFDKGEKLYQQYKDKLLCVITDMHDNKGNTRAGLELADRISRDHNDIKVLIQSSENIADKESLPQDAEFVAKNAPSLVSRTRKFLRENLGPTVLEITSNGAPGVKITGLMELENTFVDTEPKDILDNFFEILEWLNARREYELASVFYEIYQELHNKPAKMRERLLDTLEDYRYTAFRCTISDYKRDTFGPHIGLCRIGGGALGGKARGLAFISKIISSYLEEHMLPGLTITVPRTMVLSTEVFDRFLEQNDLLREDILELPDERLAAKFMKAELPTTVLGDLRSFVRQTRTPLIVRSSGVLEDALLQPFAGVYSSLLLPNESWETNLRFQDIYNAIKYVYASTFFREARTYLKSTTRQLGDEKMAVIIQEVVGKRHEDQFYPTISGVARSINHYPSGCCPPEEGVVYLALGLGKSIVEGGLAYRFCPAHPKSSPPGNTDDLLKNSQKHLYALHLETIYKMIDLDEEKTLSKLDLKTAERHGELRCTASTYVPQSERLYPGISYDGPRVIDFGPILAHGSLPLAKGIRALLRITELALGSPVEIEFAVNVERKCRKAEMYVLQVRRLVNVTHGSTDIELQDIEKDKILCYSDRALGDGVKQDITDIVYVMSDTFDISKSPMMVREVRDINNKLMDKERPFLLIGPGRWGSSDSWMGIPVNWSDIVGASVIVETPLSGRSIEPSQGSHFFHDMVSSDTGYLLLEKKEMIDWKWLEGQELVEEKDHVRHVRVKEPLEVRLDGRSGKGVIFKK